MEIRFESNDDKVWDYWFGTHDHYLCKCCPKRTLNREEMVIHVITHAQNHESSGGQSLLNSDSIEEPMDNPNIDSLIEGLYQLITPSTNASIAQASNGPMSEGLKPIESKKRFVCEEHNCMQTFKSCDKLSKHKLQHICGFGITRMDGIGVCSHESIDKYFQVIVQNKKRRHKCCVEGCKFTATKRGSIRKHIHKHLCPHINGHELSSAQSLLKTHATNASIVHVSNGPMSEGLKPIESKKRFVCEEHNCMQTFKSCDKLSKHKLQHICGFGIKGMTKVGVCSHKSLKKYFEVIVDNNVKKYKCRVEGCFRSHVLVKSFMSIIGHVHYKHVCPHIKAYELNSAQIRLQNQAINSLITSAQNRSQSQQQMRRHSKKKPFVCEEPDCMQTFDELEKLSKHKLRHICGFGIKGMTGVGVCGHKSLKKYFEVIVDNNVMKYKCRVEGCFRSHVLVKSVISIRNHVHYKHVCPHIKAYELSSAQSLVISDSINGPIDNVNIDSLTEGINELKTHAKNAVIAHVSNELIVKTNIEPMSERLKSINCKKRFVCNGGQSQLQNQAINSLITSAQNRSQSQQQMKHYSKKKRFVCEEKNCFKTFKKYKSLSEHKLEHICGFCVSSHESIEQYFETIVDNNVKKYMCCVDDCKYSHRKLKDIWRHVLKHLCPKLKAHKLTN